MRHLPVMLASERSSLRNLQDHAGSCASSGQMESPELVNGYLSPEIPNHQGLQARAGKRAGRHKAFVIERCNLIVADSSITRS
jgi:hypothetical protein